MSSDRIIADTRSYFVWNLIQHSSFLLWFALFDIEKAKLWEYSADINHFLYMPKSYKKRFTNMSNTYKTGKLFKEAWSMMEHVDVTGQIEAGRRVSLRVILGLDY